MCKLRSRRCRYELGDGRIRFYVKYRSGQWIGVLIDVLLALVYGRGVGSELCVASCLCDGREASFFEF